MFCCVIATVLNNAYAVPRCIWTDCHQYYYHIYYKLDHVIVARLFFFGSGVNLVINQIIIIIISYSRFTCL